MEFFVVLLAGIALGTLVSEVNSSTCCETFLDKIEPFALALVVAFLLCVFIFGLEWFVATFV